MGFKRPTCWLKVGCPTTVLQPLGFQSNTTFNFFRISDTKMRLFQKIAQNLSIFLQRSCWLERFWKKFFWGEMFLYLTVATRVKHWGSERESEWVCVCVCVCVREREKERERQRVKNTDKISWQLVNICHSGLKKLFQRQKWRKNFFCPTHRNRNPFFKYKHYHFLMHNVFTSCYPYTTTTATTSTATTTTSQYFSLMLCCSWLYKLN